MTSRCLRTETPAAIPGPLFPPRPAGDGRSALPREHGLTPAKGRSRNITTRLWRRLRFASSMSNWSPRFFRRRPPLLPAHRPRRTAKKRTVDPVQKNLGFSIWAVARVGPPNNSAGSGMACWRSICPHRCFTNCNAAGSRVCYRSKPIWSSSTDSATISRTERSVFSAPSG